MKATLRWKLDKLPKDEKEHIIRWYSAMEKACRYAIKAYGVRNGFSGGKIVGLLKEATDDVMSKYEEQVIAYADRRIMEENEGK